MAYQITQRNLDFLEEARKAFDKEIRLESFWSKEKDLIALRRGMDRDCIQIFVLDEEIGFFAQMIPYRSSTPDVAAYGR